MTPDILAEYREAVLAKDQERQWALVDQSVIALERDRWLAHEVLFAHRHPKPPAEFHRETVADFWSDEQYAIILAFRGSAKSTLGEEDIALAAAYRVFHNILIIGSSETRAAERLQSVSYELASNELITLMFGEQKPKMGTWTQTKIVTTANVCVQAMGRDQDIRGIKYLDFRPDFVFVDDFEDKDSVQTPEGRAKTLRWFVGELLPACAPHVKVRIRATPMDAESVPMRLKNEAGWPTHTYPIEYLDEEGKRRASWPEVFSLAWIDRQRRTYERLGELGVWNREFMCRAVSDADQIFHKEMLRVQHRERTYEAVYAMIDPARTTRATSASTGWAVWSWDKNRLVVWAAGALIALPDEIIALAFDIAERFDPVWIGIEQDGLEEFLLQPLRHEQVKRGITIPYRGMRAPRGKLDFIRGLQPFFSAREVLFAQPLPDLEAQLLNFPTGRIDAPNALAYALMMRPSSPIYDGFNRDHIVEGVQIAAGQRLMLAANATGAMTTAILLQSFDGKLRILADWVYEGGPAERAADIVEAAAQIVDTSRVVAVPVERPWDEMLKLPLPDRMISRPNNPLWIVPQQHSDRMMNVGLMQAVRAVPAEVRVGGTETAGSIHLRDTLSRTVRGLPAVEISPAARWTLRALAGGYTRGMVRGRLQDFAEEGPYRVLMEGLEAFCGMTDAAAHKEDDPDQISRVDERSGLRYASAMPARAR